MIILSKQELMYGFLSFWNTSANAFCLPFCIMNPTLLDMVAIVGLPVDGDKVSYLHDVLGTDLGFQVNKKNNVYSTFNQVSGPVSDMEHKAFLVF